MRDAQIRVWLTIVVVLLVYWFTWCSGLRTVANLKKFVDDNVRPDDEDAVQDVLLRLRATNLMTSDGRLDPKVSGHYVGAAIRNRKRSQWRARQRQLTRDGRFARELPGRCPGEVELVASVRVAEIQRLVQDARPRVRARVEYTIRRGTGDDADSIVGGSIKAHADAARIARGRRDFARLLRVDAAHDRRRTSSRS
jgi:hypothetical protein